MLRLFFPFTMLLLAGLFLACSSAGNGKPKDGKTTDTDTTLRWTVVSSGTQSAMEQPAQLLVKDQAGFDSLWQAAFKGVDVPLTKPAVDFGKYWLIAAFKGTATSGGHTVELKSMTRTDKGWLVTILHTKPGAGCMSTTVMEYPYVMATIPAQKDAAFQFTVVSEERRCE